MSNVKIDPGENSLDNSTDGEQYLVGMVNEGSYGSGDDKSNLMSQAFLDTSAEDENYAFRDITGKMSYRFVPMTSVDESHVNTISSDSTPASQNMVHFVIGNPVEVFGTQSQKKAIRREPMPSKAMVTKKRDDKRRATHNEVERRRRDKINNWITKLAGLVPNSGLPDSASKGGILAKACDYITDLTDNQKRFEHLEQKNEKLILQIIKLNGEVTDLMRENNSLRSQLADNCIVPIPTSKPSKS